MDAMTDVTHDPDRSRFRADAAHLEYTRGGDELTLLHTVVPEELGGQGLGGRLVQAAVDYAQAEGLAVVPVCSFARRWLEKHPAA